MDLAISSLPNRSIGYSPSFLSFGYHLAAPADLLCGHEITGNGTFDNFCKRMKVVWDAASENVKKARDLHARYYNERHTVIYFEIEDLVLLNTVNLRFTGMSGKLL